MAQLPIVSTKYGAPMGRHGSPLGEGARSINLFRVRLDRGGYDDGGAYWGGGEPLYCARCAEGGMQFVRARSRLAAVAAFGIEARALVQPPRAEFARLKYLEAKGVLGASGVILRQQLEALGF